MSSEEFIDEQLRAVADFERQARRIHPELVTPANAGQVINGALNVANSLRLALELLREQLRK